MAAKYWIRQGTSSVQGPFPIEAVRRYIAEGRVKATMWFSTDGREWLRGDQLPMLFPSRGKSSQRRTAPKQRRRTRRRHVTCQGCRRRIPHTDFAEHGSGRLCLECAARGVTSAAARRPSRRWLWVAVAGAGLAALGVVLVVSLGGSSDGPPSTAVLVARVEGSVASIEDDTSSGTGFVVADGVIATNAHVTQTMFVDEIRVSFPAVGPEEVLVTKVIHDDDRLDLCLLAMPTPGPPLRLSSRARVRRGESVIIIGSPGLREVGLLQNVVTPGITGPYIELDGVSLLQISAAVNPGNSGGPVLNAWGTVVAVVSCGSDTLEGMAFGVPASDLGAALEDSQRVRGGSATGLNDRHDRIAALLRLTEYGETYLAAARGIGKVMASATAEGRENDKLVLSLPPELRGRLRAANRGMAGVTLRLSSTGDPTAGSPIHSSELSALQQAVRRVAELAEKPTWPLPSYLASVRKAGGSVVSLSSSLRTRLGLNR